MNLKKWVKSIQTAGYNGARTVYKEKSQKVNILFKIMSDPNMYIYIAEYT
jgi:hypothetical protein